MKVETYELIRSFNVGRHTEQALTKLPTGIREEKASEYVRELIRGDFFPRAGQVIDNFFSDKEESKKFYEELLVRLLENKCIPLDEYKMYIEKAGREVNEDDLVKILKSHEKGNDFTEKNKIIEAIIAIE